MDYKRIIPSQALRLKILEFTDFLPDKEMVKIQYKLATGNYLNLKKPVRFTEKIQWYKLFYRDPLMTQCSDKYEVRKYIEDKGLEDILVPLYGVYDDANEIDFDELPDRFVLKTTNGSHTNILCDDKSQIDKDDIVKTMNNWIDKRSSKIGREWSYYNINPRIICEKYLDNDMNGDLTDYKFFCFNGEPFYIYVIVDRFSSDGVKLGIYDTEFKELPYQRPDIKQIDRKINKPNNFKKNVGDR